MKVIINNGHLEKIIIFILTFLSCDGIKTKDSLIYILVYSNAKINQTARLGQEKGQDYFIKNKCRYQNCFLTVNRSYFSDIKKFDVILFNVITLKDWNLTPPSARSENQLYIFVCDEPQSIYPIPSHYNGFFNLTWTYKLHSDIFFRYIIIKNKRGEVIGPKVNMHWIDVNDMEPTDEEIKIKLRTKTKAGAWFVSHCETPNKREIYVTKLNDELLKYDLKIDLYGHCASLKCLHQDKKCPKMIESDYYFYLAFENSMFEDYVTEKLLMAINNYAVPIVYGGANYSRFLPNGAYLDADILKPDELAKIINDTVNNREKYYDFFRWRKYYNYHDPYESPDTDEICSFCAYLNDYRHNMYLYKRSVYTHITGFWITK